MRFTKGRYAETGSENSAIVNAKCLNHLLRSTHSTDFVRSQVLLNKLVHWVVHIDD